MEVHDVDARRTARRLAQAWFAEPDRRPVSTAFDDRETAGSRALALRVALALLGREPAVLLDLGCGDGALLVDAAQVLPRTRLVGVDPVPEAVEAAARAVGDRAVLLTAAAEDLPLPGADAGSADLVLAHLDLALWDEPLAGLTGALRCLAPGGLLYAVDLLRPAAGQDVEPFLTAAADAGERAYLADQLEASLSLAEAEALVRAAAERAGLAGAEVVVASGGLAGATLGSAEATRLWASPGVRDAVAALGPPSPVEQAEADQVLHVRVRRTG